MNNYYLIKCILEELVGLFTPNHNVASDGWKNILNRHMQTEVSFAQTYTIQTNKWNSRYELHKCLKAINNVSVANHRTVCVRICNLRNIGRGETVYRTIHSIKTYSFADRDDGNLTSGIVYSMCNAMILIIFLFWGCGALIRCCPAQPQNIHHY